MTIEECPLSPQGVSFCVSCPLRTLLTKSPLDPNFSEHPLIPEVPVCTHAYLMAGWGRQRGEKRGLELSLLRCQGEMSPESTIHQPKYYPHFLFLVVFFCEENFLFKLENENVSSSK